MEEFSDRNGRTHRNRKAIVFLIILLVTIPLVYLIFQMNQGPGFSPDDQPNASATVWVSPVEEEVYLTVEGYSSEENAVDQIHELLSFTLRVVVSDYEQDFQTGFNLPRNALGVWMKLYFNQATEEPCVIQLVLEEQITACPLQGIEIRILLERSQT